MPKSQRDDLRSNQLLDALEPAARKRIQLRLQPVTLKLGAVVCEATDALEHGYFPQGSVLSLLTVLENGSAIETANIGYEGAFGLFEAMYSQVSFSRCIVQMEGRMVRCPMEVLHSEFRRSEQSRALFVNYSQALLSQVHQTAACNALHTMRQRICRWLLMMHDRVEGDSLQYTHEFLAHILGANRKSVTLAAQSIQTAGLISYRRGMMRVLDRAGLEDASCECYAVVRKCYDSFHAAARSTTQQKNKGARPTRKRIAG
jgi:CRP-like cAMP-binding protein